MKKKTRKKKKPSPADWLRLVEQLIKAHSTAPRTRGKYKGHSSTNTLAWVWDLARICQKYTLVRNKGKAYDENMAMASLLGAILVTWYCNVHRAKGMDPNRPLSRKQVFTRLANYRGRLMFAMCDDRLMGAVWGKSQQWNFPFGKGARGGKFV